MGTDLYSISNHRIEYADFDFDRLGREIAARLNQTRLPNPEFFWLSRLRWEASPPASVRQDAAALLQPWRLRDDDYYRTGFYGKSHWMSGLLYFSGPFEWEITVSPGNADISLLPFRYSGWAGPSEPEPDRPIRTAYRKALATLVHTLGGDEITYLADNSHVLSHFLDSSDYATMRQEMQAQLGPPLNSLAQMEAWQAARWDAASGKYCEDRAYLVDNFRDLDWSRPVVLTSDLQEFRAAHALIMPPSSPFAL
jgi:hypothetical protein